MFYLLRADYSFNAHTASRIQRILNAYTDDRPFSVNLVGAVVRQCLFVDKMHNFGWTEPGYFDAEEDELVLVHAITRYHAYVIFQ